jgi:hypothetical protein
MSDSGAVSPRSAEHLLDALDALALAKTGLNGTDNDSDPDADLRADLDELIEDLEDFCEREAITAFCR